MPGKFFFPGKSIHANTRLTSIFLTCSLFVVFGTWLNIILLCSGDVHPHPGPSSSSSESTSDLSTNMATSIFNSFSSGHNLSFVHYNIQSI